MASPEPWLYPANGTQSPPDGSDVGEVIRWYRLREGLTQEQAAVLLNTTQSRLSKLEKGAQALRDIDELRFIAARLGIPSERLGVLPDRSADARPRSNSVAGSPGPVRDSQDRWRAVRAELNRNRAVLGDLAAELYPESQRLPGTTVLSAPGWIPDGPVDLADIELTWLPESPAPPITGRAEAAAAARALRADGTSYDRYSRALRDLARPKLLDNRVSYRLLAADLADSARLAFNYTSYFDVLDVGEAVAHEFASAWLDAGNRRPSLADLPFRRLVEDPFDLTARPMLPSINTLTIRRDPIDGHRMYLHKRDSQSVAAAGGMYHVVPAGVFQPAALAPAHQANDFSLWRNIQREFSEELLGNAEHDGNAVDPIDYLTDEPFASFEQARLAGDFRTSALALVLEPLTLWVELLTVSVIEAPVFDQLFADMVAVNEEGVAVTTDAARPTVGIPFTSDTLHRLDEEPLSPIARACVSQVWAHRHTLLGR
ncbi:Xre family transcriptional regulator [Kribbella amoyensis]|uniref:Xre family transcriptional regulator n=1 Tax=Kribbella amoyensis TaxID=996641 RepID=A0A561BLF9_9ACTN|nr:helix-turn-helix transcriptional regulator [Kribbella amoyensis]TWD79731.1 Xre family transcriptional regulator [Kribbella amoyensis]